MLKQIEFNNASHPIKIDFTVVTKLCEELNISFQDFFEVGNKPEQIEKLFKYSLIRGYEIENKTFELTEDQIEDFLTEQYIEVITYFGEYLGGMVSIAEEPLPMKTDFAVIKKLCNKFQLTFDDLGEIYQKPKYLSYAFQEAVKRGYKKEGKECPYNSNQLEELINTNVGLYVQSFIVDVFTQLKDVDDRIMEEIVKKKIQEFQASQGQ